MKRHRLPPDTRLSHHDPFMPVIRDYKMSDGSRKTLVDPDYEHRYREMLMNFSDNPSWKNDPTYDMRKQRKKP